MKKNLFSLFIVFSFSHSAHAECLKIGNYEQIRDHIQLGLDKNYGPGKVRFKRADFITPTRLPSINQTIFIIKDTKQCRKPDKNKDYMAFETDDKAPKKIPKNQPHQRMQKVLVCENKITGQFINCQIYCANKNSDNKVYDPESLEENHILSNLDMTGDCSRAQPASTGSNPVIQKAENGSGTR
ncbi:MAG: hypothetical protein ACOYOK_11295 [Pseudobdellovibrionaceae bacterium]